MNDIYHTKKCFNSHFGYWMMDLGRFTALSNYLLQQKITFKEEKDENSDTLAEDKHKKKRESNLSAGVTQSGILIIEITDTIMKGSSSFGGTSSVEVRRALRSAVNNEEIKGILLSIDSPGGTVDGTDDLAREVAKVNQIKPVFAHFDGMMASAAFWIGAQASYISGTRTSLVGSLGTVNVVRDFSEAFEKEGIKTHVISTGKFKGAFVQGAEVTKEQIADLQGIVDSMNQFFKAAVKEARGFSTEQTNNLFDGRIHIAQTGLELGLIDQIQTFDEALMQLESLVSDQHGDIQEFEARTKINKNKII